MELQYLRKARGGHLLKIPIPLSPFSLIKNKDPNTSLTPSKEREKTDFIVTM